MTYIQQHHARLFPFFVDIELPEGTANKQATDQQKPANKQYTG